MVTNYRGTGGDPGWTEGQGRQSGLPEGGGAKQGHTPPSLRAERGVGAMDRRTAEGGLMRCPVLGPAPSPSRDRDLARPEDGDDSQAPRVAHRALADVHARQAEQEGGHGLRRELSRTARVLWAPSVAPPRGALDTARAWLCAPG